MNKPMPLRLKLKRLLLIVAMTTPLPASSFTIDSLFEPVFRNCSVLPDYYLRFDLSTFALHQNAFFKRQYLAEPHPDLEFTFLSYKDIISSVWNVDFLFGLGEVPGNTVFTVLNVGFGIDPKFEINLKPFLITTGFAHHCYHEIDNETFPLIHNNRFHLGVSSHNRRLNDYYRDLFSDSLLSVKNRYAWSAEAGYYLKEFFGLVGSGKLNGNSPLESEIVTGVRYAFDKRRSWVFTFRGDHTIGVFNKDDNYAVKAGNSLYWKLALGMEAFFTRGKQGGCFYALFHLDDLPVPDNAPAVTEGHWRFSKDRLLQIGIIFFN